MEEPEEKKEVGRMEGRRGVGVRREALLHLHPTSTEPPLKPLPPPDYEDGYSIPTYDDCEYVAFLRP